MDNSNRLPTYFVSHGGGPWPYIPEMRLEFARTAEWFSQLPKNFKSPPKAILMISGHWEEDSFTVSTAQRPPMIYDYSGFPEYTYHIKYPAPGDPALGLRVQSLLTQNGIVCDADPQRGLDHGAFVPLSLMYPHADMPVVTLSIKRPYNPLEHFEAGKVLEPLRDDGVLIMGSGLSYHNLRDLFNRAKARPVSIEFEKWLTQTIEEPDISKRRELLLNWEHAPLARQAHPNEDHLIPLMVVAGASGHDQGRRIFVDDALNVVMSSYCFGCQ